MFQCRHKRITWPLSMVSGSRVKPYVVCLSCHKKLEYNWLAMKVGKEINKENEPVQYFRFNADRI